MTRKLTLGLSLLLAGLTMLSAGWTFSGRGHAQVATEESAADWAARVIRLHVVANSDSDADQDLKRQVRDAILDEVTPLFATVDTPAAARTAIAEATPQILRVASAVLAAHGVDYAVEVELGQFAFPGKAYGSSFLPAGDYTALKVSLGAAAGANWWCVLFPPLCFNDWATGLLQEPKAGTGGRETVTVPRTKPAPVLVDEEQTKTVKVEARSLIWEKLRLRRTPKAQ